jgi:hypothetical protein
MPVVRHQLVAKQFRVVTFPSFGQNALEGFEVGVLAENPRAGVAAIQGVIQPARFVGSWWSWHGNSLARSRTPINES